MKFRPAYPFIADRLPRLRPRTSDFVRPSERNRPWRGHVPKITARAFFNSNRRVTCALPRRVLSGLAARADKTARSARRIPICVLQLVAPLGSGGGVMCGLYGLPWPATQQSMAQASHLADQRQDAKDRAEITVEANVAFISGACVLGLRKVGNHYFYITAARTRIPQVPA